MSTDKTWLTKNYFFAGTVAVILVNVLLFVFGGSGWQSFIEADAGVFNRIIRSFLNCFAHDAVWPLLLNMLQLLVCGLYLERKIGSLKWAALILALSFFTGAATTANYFSVQWHGFSTVIYGLFAYIIVDYLFSLRKEIRTRHAAVSGAAFIAFMYIAASFDGGVFWGYPHGLMYDLGNYTGFLTGLVFGLTLQIAGGARRQVSPAGNPTTAKPRSFLNDTGNKTRLSKNYFFAGTIVVVSANILIFAIGGSGWQQAAEVNGQADWNSLFYFNPIIRAIFNTFSHFSWSHVLNNARAFLVCGLYLERKMDSGKLVLMVLSLAFFTGAVSTAGTLSVDWAGFSGIVYLLFAYILVDYLFSFQKSKRSRFNAILGAVVLILIYIFMSGGLSFDGSREIKWYPYILLSNPGHLFGFLAGLALGLAVQFMKLSRKH